jgi:hypothetical protein
MFTENHVAICLQWMCTPTYVFDSLSTHSFLSVLGKCEKVVPLVAKLASALFLMNGNDKAYHAFKKHLEELEMAAKENLTMNFANSLNGVFGSIFSNGTQKAFILGPSGSRKQPCD